jgi:hypothetical protein
MADELFYRDPRTPQDVRGPFDFEHLREMARDLRLRPSDEVTRDHLTWVRASEFAPGFFPEGSGAPQNQEALKAAASSAQRWIRTITLAVWSRLKEVAVFYWKHLSDLRQLTTEYLTFLQDPGARRELRISADDKNDHVQFDGAGWQVELPDCCVVCGEAADCDWNSEQRSVPNLYWPLWAPLLGLLLGIAAAIFLWDEWGRWLIPLGIFIGFLVGYQVRSETLVAIRFRRCREHLNQTQLPSLRTFRKTLIVGIGDRKVWRRFNYGDRGMETPITVPPPMPAVARPESAVPEEGDGRPSYPTIRLVGDDEPTAERPV